MNKTVSIPDQVKDYLDKKIKSKNKNRKRDPYKITLKRTLERIILAGYKKIKV